MGVVFVLLCWRCVASCVVSNYVSVGVGVAMCRITLCCGMLRIRCNVVCVVLCCVAVYVVMVWSCRRFPFCCVDLFVVMWCCDV